MHEIRQQTKVIAIGHLTDSDNLKNFIHIL